MALDLEQKTSIVHVIIFFNPIEVHLDWIV